MANVEAIRGYIHQFDPAAARRMADRLIAAGDSLRDFPNRGGPGPQQTRELVIVPPYVLSYRVEGDAAYILAVTHGRLRTEA